MTSFSCDFTSHEKDVSVENSFCDVTLFCVGLWHISLCFRRLREENFELWLRQGLLIDIRKWITKALFQVCLEYIIKYWGFLFITFLWHCLNVGDAVKIALFEPCRSLPIIAASCWAYAKQYVLQPIEVTTAQCVTNLPVLWVVDYAVTDNMRHSWQYTLALK